jgi:ABC-type transporter Mla subunit MlaD
MVDPGELLTACQEAIRELGGTAVSVASAPSEIVGQVLGPLQRQAELLEQVVQQQIAFEHKLVDHALAPVRGVVDLVDQATAAMRAEAKAFRMASASLGQVADLLDQQVELLEGATAIVRNPVATLRSDGEQPRDTSPEADARHPLAT